MLTAVPVLLGSDRNPLEFSPRDSYILYPHAPRGPCIQILKGDNENSGPETAPVYPGLVCSRRLRVFLMKPDQHYDAIIAGAGASGLMCALTAGRRGRRVLLLEHSREPAKKIIASGGGRCNFTNRSVTSGNYLSHNPHFCKSALSRFTPHDIISMLEKAGIRYEERGSGQLFCRDRAGDLAAMLIGECRKSGVTIRTDSRVTDVEKTDAVFRISAGGHTFSCGSFVLAAGGLAAPRLGATDFGYRTAEKFGIRSYPCRPALVPLILDQSLQTRLSVLAGISLRAGGSTGGIRFTDDLLFTHHGLSGPLILQLSNYWGPGQKLTIDLIPGIDLENQLEQWKTGQPQSTLGRLLGRLVTRRAARVFLDGRLAEIPVSRCGKHETALLCASFKAWEAVPAGTAGYRKAEVTAGGIDTDELSSKSFECRKVPGLYITGELLDITGWLGGYNLHWAWASGHCAGNFI